MCAEGALPVYALPTFPLRPDEGWLGGRGDGGGGGVSHERPFSSPEGTSAFSSVANARAAGQKERTRTVARYIEFLWTARGGGGGRGRGRVREVDTSHIPKAETKMILPSAGRLFPADETGDRRRGGIPFFPSTLPPPPPPNQSPRPRAARASPTRARSSSRAYEGSEGEGGDA